MESSGKEKANTLLKIIGVGDKLLLLEKEEFLRSMQPFPRDSCMEECLLNNPDTKALTLQSMFSCDTAYYRGYPAASEERISDA